MVIHRVDEDRGAVPVFEDRRRVGVEIGAHGISDKPFPVFGGKNEVDEVFSERLRHGGN